MSFRLRLDTGLKCKRTLEHCVRNNPTGWVVYAEMLSAMT